MKTQSRDEGARLHGGPAFRGGAFSEMQHCDGSIFWILFDFTAS